MSQMTHIHLEDYQYELPEGRIARYPLPDRDQSKILVYNNGKISHSIFHQITDLLPVNSILFFNNTKVIPARIYFEKETGGLIEVFLLNPASPEKLMSEALEERGSSVWKCTIGNAKRWGDQLTLGKDLGNGKLSATWVNRAESLIRFDWTPSDMPFARIIQTAGATPLPPYLKREAEQADRERYQTVYSSAEGAVAAPTAGLHFTSAILAKLQEKGIQKDFLTLHVSAGTFLPIKSENAAEHRMHEEELIITKNNIINLLQSQKRVIAVGTTAMRTLESLYWYGVLLKDNPDASFNIPQELPYQSPTNTPSPVEALQQVLQRMERLQVDLLAGHTSIYIVPGYKFRLTKGLITNFHQPGSTLLLLISAFVGPDWKSIYNEALDQNYRFLSYGDSSLLLP